MQYLPHEVVHLEMSYRNNFETDTKRRIHPTGYHDAAPPKSRATNAAPAGRGLPIAHACHSGPARGLCEPTLAPLDTLASMSRRSHMFHSCSQNVFAQNAHARIKVTPGLRHHAMTALHHGCDSHAHRKPHCLACLRPTTNSCRPASCRTRECPCLSLPALALCACASRPTQPRHRPH